MDVEKQIKDSGPAVELHGAGNVRVELVAPERGARHIIRSILVNMGFTHITYSDGVEELKRSLRQRPLDLVIVDAQVPDGDMCNLVREVRHSRHGRNPFLPVVALSSDPTREKVSDVVNSGADDLLIHPYSTGQFMERISALVERRKPFVVTSDYIGPDRRTSARRGEGEEIPFLEVPNTLRVRVTGEMSDKEIEAAVAATKDQVNLLRLDRNGHQVVWLIARILAGYSWAEGQPLEQEIIEHIDRLHDVALETKSRLKGTPYEGVNHICGSLEEVAARLATDREKAARKDIDILLELGKAFEIAFKDENATEATREIYELASKGATIH